MKRILLLILAVLTLVPCLQIAGTADDGRALWATVGDNNSHLLPQDYERTLKKYTGGTLTQVHTWSGWAWKNDHANSRLDFFVQEDIPQAQLVTADLVSTNGAVIKKENITATYLGKVNTLSEAYPDIDKEVFDVITHKSVMDLAAGQLHEAWVDIYVPGDAAAGTYRTTLALRSGTQTLAEFAYELEVIDMTLTDPDDWETYLDLWETPYASNRYYSGETNADYFGFSEDDTSTNPYSLWYVHLDKKYEAGLESELELYRKAGGNAISVMLVEDPGNSRKPCPTPSMVKWTKKADGTFTYDYTDMDYWIELNLKHNINRQIDLFYHTGVGYGFVYYDEALGTITHDGGSGIGSVYWRKISYDFLQDLAEHLEEKGWFDLACLYMDERGLDITRALVEIAESVVNSEGTPLKVGGAVNADEVAQLYDRMHDISLWENIVTPKTNLTELAESRRANGQITTLYSCGSGKMSTPNEPAEAAYAVYDAYKYKVDGIMRWALNKYDEDPLHATLHYVTYPGDCYLIYPDEKDSPTMQAQSTPRFEKMCEGMRNVEKLRILRREYPEYADAVDNTAASLAKGNMVTGAARMRDRVLSLSRAVIALTRGLYTDLGEEKWFMNAARFAITNGLMQGVTNTEFAPDASMTRAMFVTVLARLDGANLNNNATSIFNDVPSGQWYTGAVVWATKNGLVTGVAPDTFAPDAKLTREQTATLLFRYATRKKYDITPRADLSGYQDSNRIGSFAVDAISWANSKGVIKGISADTLNPTGNCTRAQVAEMLRLFCQNVVNQ